MDTQNKYGSFEGELRRYILGELTEQEEEQFQERLMTGSEASLREGDEFAEVLQDELVTDYLSGKLAGAQKTAFERRLLPSHEIREKLICDKAFRAAVGRKRSAADRLGAWIRPVLRPAPAWAICATLLLLFGGSWSVYRITTLQGRLDQAVARQAVLTAVQVSLRSQVEEEQQRSGNLGRELAAALASEAGGGQRRAQTGFRGAVVPAFILKPGLVRSGGEMAQLAISAGQEIMELKLDVGIDEYPSYVAALHDSSDSELIRASNLRAVRAGKSVQVVVQLPAQVLRADDYRIRLSGVTASGETVMIDSYPFRVVRHATADVGVGRENQR